MRKSLKAKTMVKDRLRYQSYEQQSTTVYPTSSYIKISLENLNTKELRRKCNSSSGRKRNTKSFGSYKELERAVNDKNWTKKYISIKKISSAYSLNR